MKHRSAAGLAGLVLAVLLAAPAFAGPTVSVRIVGESATLVERTRVALPDTPPPVSGCAANSAGAAIDVVTGGNWDRQPFTTTILGETHDFTPADFWAEWIDRGNGYRIGSGVCNDNLNEGDEVLMLADNFGPPPDFPPTLAPLDVEGVPAQALRGSALTVTVVEYAPQQGQVGQGLRTPVAGATVQAGAVSAVTGSDGRATLTLSEPGRITVRATRPGNPPAALEFVEVGDVATVPARDTSAPEARILGIRDGRRYTRRRAPRELRGTVAGDPSGLWAVKIRLTRRHAGTCWYFSGTREQFLKRTCGKKHAFKVGEESDWSYLLPARLPRGRYWLDLYGIDNAFNKTALVRGTNRVTFTVR